eukprot:3624876-Pyramimonas_sp.AAC.1
MGRFWATGGVHVGTAASRYDENLPQTHTKRSLAVRNLVARLLLGLELPGVPQNFQGPPGPVIRNLRRGTCWQAGSLL